MKIIFKVKHSIRNFIAYFLYYSGILFIIKAVKLKDKSIVLTYHRVLDENEQEVTFSHPGIVVNKDVFANHMDFLKKNFTVLSEEEFLECFKKGVWSEKYSCLITFDDGWVDNYSNAYSILKKYDLPAVIFLPVDYIGTGKQFWQEKLSARLFELCGDTSDEGRQLLSRVGLDYLVSLSLEQAKQPIREFISNLKASSPAQRASILALVMGKKQQTLFRDNTIDVFLNWDQVREMKNNGIAFGSHSVNHNILIQFTMDEVDHEVNSSKKIIEEQLGEQPRTFCYPNGDYNEQVVDRISKGEYEAAFTTDAGFVHIADSPFTVKRINIHGHMTCNKPLFLARILGVI